MINGWFPKLNSLGEVVSGAGTIWCLGKQIASPGNYPNWLDDNLILFIGSGDVLYTINKDGSGLKQFSTIKYNLLSASKGKYLGLGVPNIYINGAFVEEGKAPSISKSGNKHCHARPYFQDQADIIVNWQIVGNALVFNTSVSDLAVCWSCKVGSERQVFGVYNKGTEKVSLSTWEEPILVDVDNVPWICSRLNDDTLIVRPWKEKFGYFFNIPCWNPDALWINGRIHIVFSDGNGNLNRLEVDITQPQIDLTLLNPNPIPPNPEPEPPDMTLQAPNEIETVKRVMRTFSESLILDEVERAVIIDHCCEDLNPTGKDKPWGRKARNADGSNKNTDALCFLRTDGKFEIYDVIAGSDHNPNNPDLGKYATWGLGVTPTNPSGINNPGDNGYWAPADDVDNIPEPEPEPIPEPEPEPDVDYSGKYSILGIGYKFGRVSGDQLLFDQKTENSAGLFQVDKNGHRYTIKHVNSGRFLGADNTKYGTDICKQFYTLPTRHCLGNYELWSIFKSPGGLVVSLIEYINQGAELAPFTSSALTLKKR